jgi:hypothetical protein
MAAKDEHWEGVKRKLSFSDWPCRQACEVLLDHHARCEDRMCTVCEPVCMAAKDEHWEGVKRKLPFTNARRVAAGGRSTSFDL